MKSSEMDMTKGPILGKLLTYSLPLIASGMLQLLFNAVDMIVVGQFTGSEALAAVGSTASLIAMMTNLFIGISLGANVCTAHAFAAKDNKVVSNVVHTAITSALIFGVVTLFIGQIFGRKLLEMMGTPDDVIELASLYIRIYFLGMPFFMLYNFGSAILKAIGDTKKPLLFLTIAGVLNAGMNVFLVVVFDMGVAGVAIATVLSQLVSAILVITDLMKSKGVYRLELKKLRLDGYAFKKIVSIGIPAGLQSTLINLSNVLIQSSVNSFGSTVMASYSVMQNLRNFAYIGVNSITQTSMSFIGQNYGVKDFKRIKKITWDCVGLVFVVGSIIGLFICFLASPLAGLYSSDKAVIDFATEYMWVFLATYGICGIMDLMPGCLRGLNSSLLPMILSILGTVGFRFFWIFLIFPHDRTVYNLFLSYPISWVVTSIVEGTAFIIVFKKTAKKYENRKQNAEA